MSDMKIIPSRTVPSLRTYLFASSYRGIAPDMSCSWRAMSASTSSGWVISCHFIDVSSSAEYPSISQYARLTRSCRSSRDPSAIPMGDSSNVMLKRSTVSRSDCSTACRWMAFSMAVRSACSSNGACTVPQSPVRRSWLTTPSEAR